MRSPHLDPVTTELVRLRCARQHDCRICQTLRLSTAANLGADEYFEAGGVCLVEWADRVAEYLPSDRLDIRLAATSDTERAIAVHATGPVARQVVSRLITRLGRDRRPENPLA